MYDKKVEISTAKIDMYIWWLIKIPLSGNGHYIYCILYILYIIYTVYYIYWILYILYTIYTVYFIFNVYYIYCTIYIYTVYYIYIILYTIYILYIIYILYSIYIHCILYILYIIYIISQNCNIQEPMNIHRLCKNMQKWVKLEIGGVKNGERTIQKWNLPNKNEDSKMGRKPTQMVL